MTTTNIQSEIEKRLDVLKEKYNYENFNKLLLADVSKQEASEFKEAIVQAKVYHELLALIRTGFKEALEEIDSEQKASFLDQKEIKDRSQYFNGWRQGMNYAKSILQARFGDVKP